MTAALEAGPKDFGGSPAGLGFHEPLVGIGHVDFNKGTVDAHVLPDVLLERSHDPLTRVVEGLNGGLRVSDFLGKTATLRPETLSQTDETIEGGKPGHKVMATAGICAMALAGTAALKPATAEGSLGLFGSKVTTVTQARNYLKFRMGETCSPLKDAVGKSIDAKSKALQEELLKPDTVEVVGVYKDQKGKGGLDPRVWKTSSGAKGCNKVSTPNVHPQKASDPSFTLAVKDIPNTAKARAATEEITEGRLKGWYKIVTTKFRGACGLQAVTKAPKPRLTVENKVKPQFMINVSQHVGEIVDIAAAVARSKASQTVNFVCGANVFTSRQNAIAKADALAAAATTIKGTNSVVVKSTDLVGDKSFAAVEAAVFKEGNAAIAAAGASAETEVNQDVSGSCAPDTTTTTPPVKVNHPPTGTPKVPAHLYANNDPTKPQGGSPTGQGELCVTDLKDPDGEPVKVRNFKVTFPNGQTLIIGNGREISPGTNCAPFNAGPEPGQAAGSVELLDGLDSQGKPDDATDTVVGDNFTIYPDDFGARV